ncbi:MAG: thiamine pyrophosphate-binding protein [Patescibacteria group bacterium]|nr:thiamine pyrophosphate-binding protein [Patescibacteria group bacterium]
MSDKRFLNGYDVVLEACEDAEATQMFGYPITPTTEILSGWINKSLQNKNLHCLQTEDEVAAGFAVCGAVMAGAKAFTATAGPGTVLMQDALSMAEGMRLPFVALIGQRGGPSSGTVIYSQQEVNLSIHGGNGEGMRIVLSPSNLEELYSLTRKVFNYAYKYRFPSILLTDGYLLKTRQSFSLPETKIENQKLLALVDETSQKNIRNIYTLEKELMSELEKNKQDFEEMSKEIVEFEIYSSDVAIDDVGNLVIAHGIVGAVAKEAVDELNKQNKKVALFRPVSLSPFPKDELNKLAQKIKNIFVCESSLGQLRDLVKQNLEYEVKISGIFKPAVGVEAEEIVDLVLSNK